MAKTSKIDIGTSMDLFLVIGDNSGGVDACVFGIYPTWSLATGRLKELLDAYEEGEDGAEYMSITKVPFNTKFGDDCRVLFS